MKVMKTLKYPLFIGLTLGMISQLTGINAFLFYSNSLFEKSGSSKDLLTTFTFILNLSGIIATLSAGSVIEKYGRKTLLYRGIQVIIFSLLSATISIYYQLNQYFFLFAVSVFNFGFNMANGPISWIYFADILPDAGISICSLNLWSVSTLVGFIFPLANASFGILSCFMFFLFCSISGMVFIKVVLIETKGKSQTQIWKEMGLDLKKGKAVKIKQKI